LIQENGPERLDFKKDLYRNLDEWIDSDVIIASSSSGLTMSEIQSACEHHPERCVIGHPFNPPHLVPLVEIVGGAKTSEETIGRVTAFDRGIGKRTIRLHKEVPGHVANRLQAALFSPTSPRRHGSDEARLQGAGRSRSRSRLAKRAVLFKTVVLHDGNLCG
jgi:3-hydroxyacyl-CoA dehydrogenase